MSKKETLIKEVRVPLTHYQGDPRAEWVVQVYELNTEYRVATEECNFNNTDNDIISKILIPLEPILNADFDEMLKAGALKKSAELHGGCSAHSLLTGIKRESAAIGVACWLVERVERVLADIPREYLDREVLINSGSEKPELFKSIDAFNEKLGLTGFNWL